MDVQIELKLIDNKVNTIDTTVKGEIFLIQSKGGRITSNDKPQYMYNVYEEKSAQILMYLEKKTIQF